ncbi:MAG TPA: type 4a pilus biogenesis protein PilO [Myxococcota bacterium]|jgi:type IV pilus assembly protein PilO|nr:type 4a pilus biogenesis protein PilO [Myxococcota bacterium]
MDLGLEKLHGGLERFAKLPKSTRQGVVAGVVVAVLLLYAWVFYLPANGQLSAAKAQELELQRKLNEVRSVAANLPKFQEELQRLQREFEVALRQLPNSKELPVLLTDVSSIGKNAGLEFKSFKPKSEVPREFYAEVPIEIEFSGSFHEIASFFDNVAKLPRIVNVSEIKMSIAKETIDGTRLQVTGNATTFRFLDSVGASTAPSAPPAKGATPPAAPRANGGGQA